MSDPIVEFAVDTNAPVERRDVVEALARVLVSAHRRRIERTKHNTEIAAGGVPAENHSLDTGAFCNERS